jgi:hypothetical protein
MPMKKLKLLGARTNESLEDFEIVPKETFAKRTKLLVGKHVTIRHALGTTREHDIDAATNKILRIERYENRPQVLVAVSGKLNDWRFDVDEEDFRKFYDGEEVKCGSHLISLAEKVG